MTSNKILLPFLIVSVLVCFAGSIPLQKSNTGIYARLVEPPPRNPGVPHQQLESLYRNTEAKCSQKNWQKNQHLCSACGNIPVELHQNEADNQHINRKYLAGESMKIILSLSQKREGFMEFRICINKFGSGVTHECFENNFFIIEESQSSRMYVPAMTGNITLNLRIPPEVPCDRYTLQWKYTIGDDYDTVCKHCETYVNCADIIILDPSLSQKFKNKLDSGMKTRQKRQVSVRNNRLKGQGSDINISFARRFNDQQSNNGNNKNEIKNLKSGEPGFTDPIYISYERPFPGEQGQNRFNIAGIADALSTSLGRQVFGANKLDQQKRIPATIPETVSKHSPRGTVTAKEIPRNTISIGKTFFDLPDTNKDSFATIKQSHFTGNAFDAKSFPSSLATFLTNAEKPSSISSGKDAENALFISNNINNNKDGFSLHLPMGFQTINRQISERQFDLKEPAVIIPVDVINNMEHQGPESALRTLKSQQTSASPESTNKFNIGGLADALSTSLGRTVFGSPPSQNPITFPKNRIHSASPNNNLAPKKVHQFFDLGKIDSKDIFAPHISFNNMKEKSSSDFSNQRSNQLAAFSVKSRTVQDMSQPQSEIKGFDHPIGFQTANSQTEVRPFESTNPSITVPTDPLTGAGASSTSGGGNDAALATAIAVSEGGVGDVASDMVSGASDAMSGMVDTVSDVASNVAETASGAVSDVLSVTSEGVSSAGEVLADAASSITDNLPGSDTLADVASNTAEAVAGATDIISDAASSAVEAVSSVQDNLPDIVPSPDSVSDAASSVMETMTGGTDTITDAASALGEAVSGIVDNLPSGDSVIDSVPSVAEGAIETLADGASDITSSAIDTLSDVASSPGEVISNIQDNLPEIKVADSVTDAASSAIESLAGAIETVADESNDMASSAIDTLGDVASGPGEVISNIQDNLPEIKVADSVTDAASSAIESVAGAVETIVDGAKDTIESVVDNIGDLAGDTISDGIDSLPAIVPEIKDGLDSGGDALPDITSAGDVISGISDALPDSVSDGVGEIISDAASSLSDSDSSIAAVVASAGENIVDKITDTDSIGSELLSNAAESGPADSLKEINFGSAGELISDAVNSIADKVKETVSDINDKSIVLEGTDIVDKIGDAVPDTADSLSSIIGETTSNIVESVDNKPLDGVIDNVKDIVSDINDKRNDIFDDSASAAVLLANSNILSRGKSKASSTGNIRSVKLWDSTPSSINSKLSLFQIPPSPFKEVKSDSRTLPIFSDMPPPPPPPSITLVKSTSFTGDLKDDFKISSDSRTSSPNYISSLEKDDGKIKIDRQSDESKKQKVVSLSDSMLYVLAGDYGKYQLGLDKIVGSDSKRMSLKLPINRDDRKLNLPVTGQTSGLNDAIIFAASENSAVGDAFSDVIDNVGLGDTKDNILDSAVDSVVDATSGLKDSASDTLDSMVDKITDVSDKIKDMTSLDNTILDKTVDHDIGLKDVIENVGEIVSDATDSASDIVDGSKITDQISDVVDTRVDTTSSMIENTREIVTDAADTVSDMVDGSKLTDPVSDIVETGVDLASGVKDTISDITDKAKDITGDIVDNTGDIASNTLERVSEFTDTMKDATSDVGSSIADSGLGEIVSNAADGASNMREHAGDVMSSVSDTLTDAASNMKDTISNTMDATSDIVSGMKDTVSDISDGLDSDRLRNLAVISSLQNNPGRSIQQSSSVLDNTVGNTRKVASPSVDLITFFKAESLVNGNPITPTGASNNAHSGSTQMGFNQLFSEGSTTNSNSRFNTDLSTQKNSKMSAFTKNIGTVDLIEPAVTGSTIGAGKTKADSVNIWSWSVNEPALDITTSNTAKVGIQDYSDTNRRNSVLNANTRSSSNSMTKDLGLSRNTVSVKNANPSLQQFLLKGLQKSSGSTDIQTARRKSSSITTSFQKSTSSRTFDRMRAIGPADASSRVGMRVNTRFNSQSWQSPTSLDSVIGNQASVGRQANQRLIGGVQTAEFRNRRNVLDTALGSGHTIGVKSRSFGPQVGSIINRPGFSEVPVIRPKVIKSNTFGQAGSSIENSNKNTRNGISAAASRVSSDMSRSNQFNNGLMSQGKEMTISRHSPVQVPGVCRPNEEFDCKASSTFLKVPGIDWWCVNNCRQGNCNRKQCRCHCISKIDKSKRELSADDVNRIISLQQQTEISLHNVQLTQRQYKLAANMKCKPTKMYEAAADIDKWCDIICAMGDCPTHVCDCPP